MSPSKSTLVMWNKKQHQPLGECTLTLINPKNKKKYREKFTVVSEDFQPLLALNTMLRMGFITINQYNFIRVNNVDTVDPILEYKDLFNDDLGRLPGTVHFEVDESVKPVVSPSHNVEVAIMPLLKKTLDNLVDKEVISPVDKPTDWLSNMVKTPKKNGELRICLDPKPLNKALKRERFQLPKLKDKLPQLAKAKVYSTFDCRHGYWHVVLDEESSLLTTFDTPFGRYRWLRLPYGAKPSAEMFQKSLYKSVGDLENLINIADDMLLYGCGDTMEEAICDHDRHLVVFLQRCRDRGIKLNKEKKKLRKTEVKFMGHLLTSEGIKVDPDKVAAIADMPAPVDTKGVQRLCGMINYLSEFLPDLATVMEPINMLKHQDVPFNWANAQRQAFAKVKEMVTSDQLLQYYNPDKELAIQCDASESGLGAALLQERKPVAYASRALTDTETRWAQIEKELLAIVYAVEKYNQYTYGRHVNVRSDHKPLEAILAKPLYKAPKRLQSLMLRLQKYDVSVEYLKGKEMYLADTLSRAYLPTSTKSGPQDDLLHVHMTQFLPISDQRLEAIRKATKTDSVMQSLRETIMHGWPDHKQDLTPEVALYFHFRDEMTVVDGIILRGSCCDTQ